VTNTPVRVVATVLLVDDIDDVSEVVVPAEVTTVADAVVAGTDNDNASASTT